MKHLEFSLKSAQGQPRTRLAPGALTVGPALLQPVLGLALPPVTALSRSLLGMAMTSPTAAVWSDLGATWPLRSKSPLGHQPQWDREKTRAALGSWGDLAPPRYPNTLSISRPQHGFHPRPLKMRRGWGALPCHVPSMKYPVPPPKLEMLRLSA